MHRILIGYAPHLTATALRQMFQPDPDVPGASTPAERLLALAPVDPGDHEVYGPEDYPGLPFDAGLLRRLFPFDLPDGMLARLDPATAKSVFWVRLSSGDPVPTEGITVAGVVDLPRFYFEPPSA